jgi:hypothetical protein
MRDLSIGHYVAAAVPVLAAGFGIHYLVRQHHPSMTGKEVATKTAHVEKDSAQNGKGEHGDKSGKADRKIALAKDHERTRNAGTSIEREEAEALRHADDHEKDRNHKERNKDSRKPSSELEAATNDAVATGVECLPIEYRGDGPQATKVTRGEWNAVMDQFHGAKHAILSMIEKRHHDMPEATAQALEHQVRNLKIQRPPASDEPDLAWRGIGVYAQSIDGEPMIKIGGGFVHLVTKHPARARFEMTRLVAQSLAPCELKRIGAAEGTWNPLLRCMNMTDTQSCAQGTYSESGWAVSTTLAAAVAAPGCQVSAFRNPDLVKCMRNIPLSKTVVNVEEPSSDSVSSSLSAPAWSTTLDGGPK